MTIGRQRILRRRLMHLGYVLMAVVLLAPKIDLPAAPQFAALLEVVGLAQAQNA